MRKTHFCSLAVAALLISGSPLTAQLRWVRRVSEHAPPGRRDAAMAYDVARDRVVLFGGTSFLLQPPWPPPWTLSDTWEWDGTDWIQQHPLVSPPAGPANMVYDNLRQMCVLTTGSETWEWNGLSWSLRATSGVAGEYLAFDSIRGVTVAAGNGGVVSEWNGTTWTTKMPTTPAMYRTGNGFRSMAFDPNRGRCLIFAAHFDTDPSPIDNLWEWDGTDWQVSPSAPSPIYYWFGMTLAYNPDRGKVMWYGGTRYSGDAFWTFELQPNNAWTLLTSGALPTTGAERLGACLVHHAGRGTMLSFGGTSFTNNASYAMNDTWELTDQPIPADASAYGSGCGTPALELHPNPMDRPLIGATWSAQVQNAGSGPAVVAWGTSGQFLSTSAWGAFPYALDYLGMEGCSLLTNGDLTLSAPCTLIGSQLQHSLGIPYNPVLFGSQVYGQAYAVRTGANTLGVVLSNAVQLTISDF